MGGLGGGRPTWEIERRGTGGADGRSGECEDADVDVDNVEAVR